MEILKTRGFSNIYEVDAFRKEFERMFGKSKSEYTRYIDWLEKKLHILDDIRGWATDCNGFEKLVDCGEPLYSIRYSRSKKNPRVIYCLIRDKAVLLTAFLEKSTSDYKAGCDRAINRLRKLLKGR